MTHDDTSRTLINVMKNHPFILFVRQQGGNENAARILGMSPHTIVSLKKGARRVRPDLALRIEELSGGKISKESLVWPQQNPTPAQDPKEVA